MSAQILHRSLCGDNAVFPVRVFFGATPASSTADCSRSRHIHLCRITSRRAVGVLLTSLPASAVASSLIGHTPSVVSSSFYAVLLSLDSPPPVPALARPHAGVSIYWLIVFTRFSVVASFPSFFQAIPVRCLFLQRLLIHYFVCFHTELPNKHISMAARVLHTPR